MRAIATCLVALCACVDNFQGSNVQFDFSFGMPAMAPVGLTPRPGEVANNMHYTLYAFELDDMAGRLFEVQKFEIHHIVDLVSPCFIDRGEHVPHPGLHVTQYAKVIGEDTGIADVTMPPPGATEQQKIEAATAVQRDINIKALASDMGIKVVSSASINTYPAMAADCTDPNGIPPPDCTDEGANARRLQACETFWANNGDYYEGTDRILTSPLNGTAHGMVDGINPINLAPVGGAQFFVDEVLDNFAGFAVYLQPDDQVGPGGQLFLFGKPTQTTRGVIHVHMTSSVSPTVTADLAIFSNIGEDDVSF